ncbi:MAG: hypothetical protein ACOYNS_14530 [Bacteroidota bacterium]
MKEDLTENIRTRTDAEPAQAVAAAESKTKDRWDTHQHVEDETAPELYSKRVIYTFSFLFSVLFGAVLMVMNLRRLNKPEGVVPTVSFSIAFFLSIIYLEDLLETSYGFTLPNSNVFAFIGAWLILELVWNKYIGKELQYRRRSYIKPMIVGIIIAAVFILATVYSVESK